MVKKPKYAKNYECKKCGNKGYGFYPINNIDEEPQTYCRKCLQEIKEKFINEY